MLRKKIKTMTYKRATGKKVIRQAEMTIAGMPVLDATKPLQIHVAAKDVQGARRRDPKGCAMAEAIKRSCHANEVRVHTSRVYVQAKKDEPFVRYETPQPLRVEIISFDRSGQFQEDDYILRKVTSGHNAEGRQTYKKQFPRLAAPNAPKRKSPRVLRGVRASMHGGRNG